jgi:hypothetical protein
MIEELDDPAVSALGVQTWKATFVRSVMGNQNLLSRAPSCFGKHVKLLVPAALAIVNTHSSFKEG